MLVAMSSPSRKLATVDDLLALGEDTKSELIDGEILPKALPGEPHQHAETTLTRWLGRRFDRAASASWPGGWFIRHEVHCVYAREQVFCHDLAGWRRDRLELGARGWVHISPDWVCEVLSDGHKRRDRLNKPRVLHEHAVPHYWLIDFEEKLLEIYRYAPSGYALVNTVTTGEVVRLEPFTEVELRTSVIFGDEDDEA